MSINYGKIFEKLFKKDWLNSLPSSTIDRLYDPTSGYLSISNISDFIAYNYPNIFYIETKSHKGNTFPLSNLTQYDKLALKIGIKGVRSGVVIWFIDHDTICYIPISVIKQMKEDGKKSVNIKMLDSKEYNIIKIPTIKKRTYLIGDYSCLLNLKDGE